MSDSLKDQLIALGLAKAQQPKGPEKAQRKKPSGSKRKGKKPAGELSLDEAYRLRQKEEKETAKAKRLRKRAEDLERRRINGEIQQLVDAHSLNDKAADIKRNFLYKGRIRSVLVTPDQLQALNAGELGVIFLRGNYVLMLPEHVEAVRKISPEHVPDLLADNDAEEEEFPVPDDLVW